LNEAAAACPVAKLLPRHAQLDHHSLPLEARALRELFDYGIKDIHALDLIVGCIAVLRESEQEGAGFTSGGFRARMRSQNSFGSLMLRQTPRFFGHSTHFMSTSIDASVSSTYRSILSILFAGRLAWSRTRIVRVRRAAKGPGTDNADSDIAEVKIFERLTFLGLLPHPLRVVLRSCAVRGRINCLLVAVAVKPMSDGPVEKSA
jgi:hypothetical protein